jgi:hypothetical protein
LGIENRSQKVAPGNPPRHRKGVVIPTPDRLRGARYGPRRGESDPTATASTTPAAATGIPRLIINDALLAASCNDFVDR